MANSHTHFVWLKKTDQTKMARRMAHLITQKVSLVKYLIKSEYSIRQILSKIWGMKYFSLNLMQHPNKLIKKENYSY